MLGIQLPQPEVPLKVLCLGAHCDDIEIGCGASMLDLLDTRPVECTWVVFCSNDVRAVEARKCAEVYLAKAHRSKIIIERFRDGFLPYLGYEVKERFEQLKQQVDPDLIFTHYAKDKHQDHRLVSELSLNTFRNHLILEYEIPKYDGDMSSPNTFIPVSEQSCELKIDTLMKYYGSQRSKMWFDDELFRSLMRIRGMESNSETRYAEAFYCNKMVLG